MPPSNQGPATAPGHNKEYHLIVNGNPHTVKAHKQSYDDIVKLEFPNPNYEKTAYTVTFSRGEEPKPKGTMSEGDSVTVKDGMVFNVTPTGKS